MNFENYVSWNDPNIIAQLKAKCIPELQETIPKNLLKLFLSSKSGYIKIKKVSDNGGYLPQFDTFEGVTASFGIGLNLSIVNASEWYRTSEIKKILKNTFETNNSIYEYEFNEISPEDVINEIDSFVKDNKITLTK